MKKIWFIIGVGAFLTVAGVGGMKVWKLYR